MEELTDKTEKGLKPKKGLVIAIVAVAVVLIAVLGILIVPGMKPGMKRVKKDVTNFLKDSYGGTCIINFDSLIKSESGTEFDGAVRLLHNDRDMITLNLVCTYEKRDSRYQLKSVDIGEYNIFPYYGDYSHDTFETPKSITLLGENGSESVSDIKVSDMDFSSVKMSKNIMTIPVRYELGLQNEAAGKASQSYYPTEYRYEGEGYWSVYSAPKININELL